MTKEIQSVNYGLEKIFSGAQDFLPLLGTDYVEFYVGNAKQAAHFYKTAFGFQSHAYKGLETGSKESVSYVLKQDKIRLVLTTPLTSKSPINEHITKHGDGVKAMDEISKRLLDESFHTSYGGPSRDFKESSSNTTFAFLLALLLIYLVLAGQFESFKDPLLL